MENNSNFNVIMEYYTKIHKSNYININTYIIAAMHSIINSCNINHLFFLIIFLIDNLQIFIMILDLYNSNEFLFLLLKNLKYINLIQLINENSISDNYFVLIIILELTFNIIMVSLFVLLGLFKINNSKTLFVKILSDVLSIRYTLFISMLIPIETSISLSGLFCKNININSDSIENSFNKNIKNTNNFTNYSSNVDDASNLYNIKVLKNFQTIECFSNKHIFIIIISITNLVILIVQSCYFSLYFNDFSLYNTKVPWSSPYNYMILIYNKLKIFLVLSTIVFNDNYILEKNFVLLLFIVLLIYYRYQCPLYYHPGSLAIKVIIEGFLISFTILAFIYYELLYYKLIVSSLTTLFLLLLSLSFGVIYYKIVIKLSNSKFILTNFNLNNATIYKIIENTTTINKNYNNNNANNNVNSIVNLSDYDYYIHTCKFVYYLYNYINNSKYSSLLLSFLVNHTVICNNNNCTCKILCSILNNKTDDLNTFNGDSLVFRKIDVLPNCININKTNTNKFTGNSSCSYNYNKSVEYKEMLENFKKLKKEDFFKYNYFKLWGCLLEDIYSRIISSFNKSNIYFKLEICNVLIYLIGNINKSLFGLSQITLFKKNHSQEIMLYYVKEILTYKILNNKSVNNARDNKNNLDIYNTNIDKSNKTSYINTTKAKKFSFINKVVSKLNIIKKKIINKPILSKELKNKTNNNFMNFDPIIILNFNYHAEKLITSLEYAISLVKQFWYELIKATMNTSKLENLSFLITTKSVYIQNLANKTFLINPNDLGLIKLYGCFLSKVWRLEDESKKYLSKAYLTIINQHQELTNNIKANKSNIEFDLLQSNKLSVIIVSGNYSNIGMIKYSNQTFYNYVHKDINDNYNNKRLQLLNKNLGNIKYTFNSSYNLVKEGNLHNPEVYKDNSILTNLHDNKNGNKYSYSNKNSIIAFSPSKNKKCSTTFQNSLKEVISKNNTLKMYDNIKFKPKYTTNEIETQEKYNLISTLITAEEYNSVKNNSLIYMKENINLLNDNSSLKYIDKNTNISIKSNNKLCEDTNTTLLNIKPNILNNIILNSNNKQSNVNFYNKAYIGYNIDYFLPDLIAKNHKNYMLNFYNNSKGDYINNYRNVFIKSLNNNLLSMTINVKLFPCIKLESNFVGYLNPCNSYNKNIDVSKKTKFAYIMTNNKGNILGVNNLAKSEFDIKSIHLHNNLQKVNNCFYINSIFPDLPFFKNQETNSSVESKKQLQFKESLQDTLYNPNGLYKKGLKWLLFDKFFKNINNINTNKFGGKIKKKSGYKYNQFGLMNDNVLHSVDNMVYESLTSKKLNIKIKTNFSNKSNIKIKTNNNKKLPCQEYSKINLVKYCNLNKRKKATNNKHSRNKIFSVKDKANICNKNCFTQMSSSLDNKSSKISGPRYNDLIDNRVNNKTININGETMINWLKEEKLKTINSKLNSGISKNRSLVNNIDNINSSKIFNENNMKNKFNKIKPKYKKSVVSMFNYSTIKDNINNKSNQPSLLYKQLCKGVYGSILVNNKNIVNNPLKDKKYYKVTVLSEQYSLDLHYYIIQIAVKSQNINPIINLLCEDIEYNIDQAYNDQSSVASSNHNSSFPVNFSLSNANKSNFKFSIDKIKNNSLNFKTPLIVKLLLIIIVVFICINLIIFVIEIVILSTCINNTYSFLETTNVLLENKFSLLELSLLLYQYVSYKLVNTNRYLNLDNVIDYYDKYLNNTNIENFNTNIIKSYYKIYNNKTNAFELNSDNKSYLLYKSNLYNNYLKKLSNENSIKYYIYYNIINPYNSTNLNNITNYNNYTVEIIDLIKFLIDTKLRSLLKLNSKIAFLNPANAEIKNVLFKEGISYKIYSSRENYTEYNVPLLNFNNAYISSISNIINQTNLYLNDFIIKNNSYYSDNNMLSNSRIQTINDFLLINKNIENVANSYFDNIILNNTKYLKLNFDNKKYLVLICLIINIVLDIAFIFIYSVFYLKYNNSRFSVFYLLVDINISTYNNCLLEAIVIEKTLLVLYRDNNYFIQNNVNNIDELNIYLIKKLESSNFKDRANEIANFNLDRYYTIKKEKFIDKFLNFNYYYPNLKTTLFSLIDANLLPKVNLIYLLGFNNEYKKFLNFMDDKNKNICDVIVPNNTLNNKNNKHISQFPILYNKQSKDNIINNDDKINKFIGRKSILELDLQSKFFNLKAKDSSNSNNLFNSNMYSKQSSLIIPKRSFIKKNFNNNCKDNNFNDFSCLNNSKIKGVCNDDNLFLLNNNIQNQQNASIENVHNKINEKKLDCIYDNKHTNNLNQSSQLNLKKSIPSLISLDNSKTTINLDKVTLKDSSNKSKENKIDIIDIVEYENFKTLQNSENYNNKCNIDNDCENTIVDKSMYYKYDKEENEKSISCIETIVKDYSINNCSNFIVDSNIDLIDKQSGNDVKNKPLILLDKVFNNNNNNQVSKSSLILSSASVNSIKKENLYNLESSFFKNNNQNSEIFINNKNTKKQSNKLIDKQNHLLNKKSNKINLKNSKVNIEEDEINKDETDKLIIFNNKYKKNISNDNPSINLDIDDIKKKVEYKHSNNQINIYNMNSRLNNYNKNLSHKNKVIHKNSINSQVNSKYNNNDKTSNNQILNKSSLINNINKHKSKFKINYKIICIRNIYTIISIIFCLIYYYSINNTQGIIDIYDIYLNSNSKIYYSINNYINLIFDNNDIFKNKQNNHLFINLDAAIESINQIDYSVLKYKIYLKNTTKFLDIISNDSLFCFEYGVLYSFQLYNNYLNYKFINSMSRNSSIQSKFISFFKEYKIDIAFISDNIFDLSLYEKYININNNFTSYKFNKTNSFIDYIDYNLFNNLFMLCKSSHFKKGKVTGMFNILHTLYNYFGNVFNSTKITDKATLLYDEELNYIINEFILIYANIDSNVLRYFQSDVNYNINYILKISIVKLIVSIVISLIILLSYYKISKYFKKTLIYNRSIVLLLPTNEYQKNYYNVKDFFNNID